MRVPHRLGRGIRDARGGGAQSLYKLGKKKGFELVNCEKNGATVFFVDKKYYARFGIADNSPARLYRPPQFGLEQGGRAPNGRGWPPVEKGPWAQRFNKPLERTNVRIPKKWVER